ncbi:MAG: hypothetical protein IJZ89_00450 [Clostridia bacterium]|nr:hypothetical protein [Clostridia bacterium]
MEKTNRKYESLRRDGIEILRIGRSVSGYEELPEKIRDFYSSLAERAAKGAMDKLGKIAEADFEKAKENGARSMAFFKRYNYLFDCFADLYEERFIKIKISINLSRSGSELYALEAVHIWDRKEQTMLPERKAKKLLTGEEQIVKK